MKLPVHWVDVLESLRPSASVVDAEWMKRHRKTDTIKLMTCILSSLQHRASIKSILHTIDKAKRLYKQRWDIEETFKSLKCTIGLRASQLKTNAKTELSKYMWVCASLHYLQRLNRV